MADDFAAQVAGIGALAEPVRRALYLYVVAQPEPVSRDQAAAGTDLPRHTVKFHLDKLVDEGLLDAEFRRLTGRQGPGAGRPSKLYRRSQREMAVTLPEREYELVAEILAAAIEDAAAGGTPVLDAVARAADDAGRRLGARAAANGSTTAASSSLESVSAALAAHGFEPRAEGDDVVLANCPFHALSRSHTQLVCHMNHGLISAMADELGHDDVDVKLEPGPNRCCVKLSATSAPTPRS